jgi:hypothetical protein
MTPNSSPGGHRDHLGGATNEPSALAQRPAGSGRPLEGERRPPRHGTRGARHGAPACIGLSTRVYPRRPAMSHGPWPPTAPPTMLRVASTLSTLRSSGRGHQLHHRTSIAPSRWMFRIDTPSTRSARLPAERPGDGLPLWARSSHAGDIQAAVAPTASGRNQPRRGRPHART